MQDRYGQIQFIAANYSRLQGLRSIPVGMLVVFVSVWALYNQGPTADLSAPILVTIVAALLYWLADHYYNRVFGKVKQTPHQRKWEFVSSVGFGVLGLLAFGLDTTEVLPISTLGLVFAISFFEYFWRTNKPEWGTIFTLFPENAVAAILVLVVSMLPLFGISWWSALGIKSQVVGVFMVVGIVIILTGIWGHIRMVHLLSTMEAKSDDITV
jgi:hypothetical protein